MTASCSGRSYLYELHNTDTQVGRLLEELGALALTDTTLVILTADHGGHADLHGQDIPEDMLVPWIIAGPGVITGTALDEVNVADTAATVLWVLGLPLPQAALGQPVYAAFGS